MGVLLEICVDDPTSVREAVAGGADRLELCSALDLGGLTPSAALIDHAVATGLPVHCMIRPRSGEYILQEGDIAVMTADIRLALARGAKGVVVGALLPDGRLDREAMARFRDAASDATIVLHRAIDLSADPVATVREARALGFDKVLSSGGAISAPLGVHILARMVDAAGPDLAVIAGGGVRSDNVAALVAESGVREVHSSASRSALPPSGKTVRLGFAHGPRRLTERAIVAKMRDVLAGLETSI